MTDSAFKKFEESEKFGGHHVKRGISVNRIINECDPETSEYDRRIIFELIGRKLNENDYNDESSFSEDTDSDSDGEGQSKNSPSSKA